MAAPMDPKKADQAIRKFEAALKKMPSVADLKKAVAGLEKMDKTVATLEKVAKVIDEK